MEVWQQSLAAGSLNLPDITQFAECVASVLFSGCPNCDGGGCTDLKDLFPPTASCKTTTYALGTEGTATVYTEDIDDGSTDECALEYKVIPETVDCGDMPYETVTLTVEDPSDNSADCTTEVEVVDDMDPTADCKGSTYTLSSEADTGTAPVYTEDIEDGSEDNCDIEDYSVTPETVDCAPLYVGGDYETVTLTVEDPSDNSADCTTEVEVVDNMDPTAYCEGSTYTLSSEADTGTAPVYTEDIEDGSTDNCFVDDEW
eukprot:72164_1